MVCKKCGQGFDDRFNNCPNCGESTVGKNKKPIYKKWWFWLIIVLVFIIIVGSASGGGSEEKTTERETVAGTASETASGTVSETEASAQEADTKDNVYKKGEIFNDNGLKIAFVDAEIWNGYNQYMAPAQGNVIIRYYFEIENTADSDRSVSYFDFSAYCDGKAVEQKYFDDDLSASLSTGRKDSGYVYFEIPAEAKVVEAEYEYDYWNDSRVIFRAEIE